MSEQPPAPVRLKHRILYGLGYLPVALTTDVTLTWLLKCYRPDPTDTRWQVLVTATAFAVAVVVGRVVDGLADPLVGYWSDRLSSRLGRRKPFILIGAPVWAAVFVFIWTPPTPGVSLANAVYLGGMLSVFFFVYTFVVCPYLAMLPEITPSRTERVALTSWQAAFAIVGAVGGMVLAGYLIEHFGYRAMGLCLAPVIVLCAWAPLFVPQPQTGFKPSSFPLRPALAWTFRNPLFPAYALAALLFWIALRMMLLTLPKLLEVRTHAGEASVGAILGIALLAAGLMLPFMPRLSSRIGKKRLLLGGLLYLGILMLPLPFLGALPIPLSPLGQAFLLLALAGPAMATVFTLPNAILADIVDRDEQSTGERREAMYYAVQGLITNLGMGFGGALAALLLDRFGESAAHQGGFLACTLVSLALAALAAAALSRYRGH